MSWNIGRSEDEKEVINVGSVGSRATATREQLVIVRKTWSSSFADV